MKLTIYLMFQLNSLIMRLVI